MLKKNVLSVVYLLCITMITAGCGSVQHTSAPENYPARPITMTVPFSAGGSVDLVARTLEKTAVNHLGQPLVVVNKPGAGGAICWNELTGAKPDGYTIGLTTVGLIMHPLYGPTKYNYPTALEPLAQVTISPIVATVRADQPWQNLEELVNYAKQHPSAIKFGHPGLGTIVHVTGETFAREAGISIEQVPFLGASEGITALLGGHIQLMFSPFAEIKEHVKSGKVRILAVAGDKRLPQPEFTNVPTFKEQGLNVAFSLWIGVGAPKELPEDVKKKLAEGFKGIVNDPSFKKNLEDMGLAVEYMGPQESVDKWISDSTSLGKIINETGIAERIASQKK